MDDAALKQVLEARARSLARTPQVERVDEGTEVVVIALATERYGVPLKFVHEIRPWRSVTRVPGTPPYWSGLVNLRGRLFPVLDLARYLSLPTNSSVESSKLVLVVASGIGVCLWVDDVIGVRRLSTVEVGPLFAQSASIKREVVVGITPDLLSLVDLEALLADPRLVIHEQVY